MYLLACCLCLSFTSALAQSETEALLQFNQKRLKITRIGMLTLGGWALGNIGTSAVVLSSGVSGSTAHFYRMNLYWNAVNLAVAGLGYYGSLGDNPASLGPFASVREQHNLEKILLFNAGLDVAYIVGGLYLNERANNSDDRRNMFQGFGRSVVLQGGFLLVFDVAMYFIHHTNFKPIQGILDNVTFSGNAAGIILRF